MNNSEVPTNYFWSDDDVYDRPCIAQHTLDVFAKIKREFAKVGVVVEETPNLQNPILYEIQVFKEDDHNDFFIVRTMPALVRYYETFMDGYKAAMKIKERQGGG